MFLAIAEVLIAILVIWFLVSQIFIPLATGSRLLPVFRGGGKKAVLKDMILDEKDKIEEEELRHSLNEMRQKEKKDGQV